MGLSQSQFCWLLTLLIVQSSRTRQIGVKLSNDPSCVLGRLPPRHLQRTYSKLGYPSNQNVELLAFGLPEKTR